MKHASASRVLAVAAATCAVVVLGACRTVRTSEKWRRGSTGMSEMEQRWSNSQQESLRTRNALMDPDNDSRDEFDFTESEWNAKTEIGSNENRAFGKRFAQDKSFRTKDFAGADEYKGKDYHFLKRQDYKEKTSRDQEERYSTGEAREERRRFFGRNKRARTKDFAEGDKELRTGSYREAEADLDRLQGRDLTIVRDDAQQDGAAMTVEDVRTMLHGAQ